jgi:histidinol-phosphate phosphatase family domain/HAD-superfamily hydrolase, subfamily IIIA
MLNLKQINKDWTLFLDRDGVINHDKDKSYIFSFDEFRFYDGVLDALKFLSSIFSRIVVVTNQRGVGRGLMTEETLIDIHHRMQEQIEKAGGRIDAIFYCTANNNEDPNRKPNPGMFYQAKAKFPEITPGHSLIVGNNISDMEFGRNAGIHTVFVKTTQPHIALPHPAIDLAFDSLPDFAKALREA